MAEAPYMIVGLGNPGPEYAATRHNMGWMVVERFAADHRLGFDRVQLKARVGTGSVGGRRVVLAKPLTYMNASGQAVAALIRFYKVPLDQMLVVYDELDLPLGVLRLRGEGGAGGHNGMRSLISALGTQAFARLRVGVSRPPPQWDPADYLLTTFTPQERAELPIVIENASQATEVWLTQGLLAAMNRFNRREG